MDAGRTTAAIREGYTQSRFRDEGTGNSSEGIHAKNRPSSYQNGGEGTLWASTSWAGTL
jgi:hypothetical protein